MCSNITNRLKDAGIKEGDVVCILGGSLMTAFQKSAYPKCYNKTLNAGAPTNIIGSRLSAMRQLNQKGVTKVKIPQRSEQASLEYLKVEMRGEE